MNKDNFMKINVYLNDIKKLNKFVNTIKNFDEVVADFVSGRYVINAKSIMGILSLDLSEPKELRIYSDDKNILKALKEFEYVQ